MITAVNAIIILEYAKREKKFTEYEELFVKSIQRMGSNRALTTKQEAIVDKIYRRCVGGGEKEFHQYSK
uniref:Uncharacterized protein n=1 Tax=viral metagenome TaxID=1070528 RepID=A0A6M3K0N1_9ZZZZ